MLTEVRSYSLALWLYAKGHRPIDAGLTPNGTLVFTFAPGASAEFAGYSEAKLIFNNLEAQARRLVVRAEGSAR